MTNDFKGWTEVTLDDSKEKRMPTITEAVLQATEENIWDHLGLVFGDAIAHNPALSEILNDIWVEVESTYGLKDAHVARLAQAAAEGADEHKREVKEDR